jgi:sec-independent protein translocase protein TatC
MRLKRVDNSHEMPFLDHLEELRWRIIWSLAALLLTTCVGFLLVTKFDVLGLLIRPITPFLHGTKLKYLNPTDPFFITLHLAVVVGVLLALPIVVYHIWAFVAPALKREEKRSIVPALYLGLVLFMIGAAMAYFGAIPITLRFMMSFQSASLEQNIVISEYMGFVVKIILAFGLVFELPVVVLILATLGLITSSFLVRMRRYFVVTAAIAASLLTPGDAVSLTLFLMAPLMLLYELSILLAKTVEKRRARAAAAEAAAEAAEAAAEAGRLADGDLPAGAM